MYETLSHLHPRQGQHQAVLDQLFRWEQEHLPTVTGYVGGYLLEPLSAPFGILVMVVFDSQAAYTRHRDDPQQDHWEQHLQDLLEHAPEWHEGEITELFAEAHGL
jgi:heme-degrading monooxygenase HmoA